MLVNLFAEYAQHDATRELPGDVIHHAKRALLDWFSALIPVRHFLRQLTLFVPTRRSWARQVQFAGIGHGRLSGTAAWINGSASHSVEFDDIFRDALYHPGCPTIAAALAVAEDQGRSGMELLKAITIGYEISTRIGEAIQPSHSSFSTLPARPVVLAPPPRRCFDEAPGNRSCAPRVGDGRLDSAIQQAFRSDAMTKPLHAGHAAWVGVAAGQGAANGITGAQDMLEGPAGFGAAMSQKSLPGARRQWSVAPRSPSASAQSPPGCHQNGVARNCR